MTPTKSSVFNDHAFRGRVYGVTGAAHGIGEQTARSLCALGANVVIVDMNAENLAKVIHDLRASDAGLISLRGDVSKKTTLARAIKAAEKKWGRIDGWVTNAMFNPTGIPEESKEADVRRALAVNFEAAWNTALMLAPIMRRQGGGSIVNIGSIQARRSLPGNTVYAACKSALEGMTSGLAQDLAPDRIRVNLIVPGAIDTGHSHRSLSESPERTEGVPAEVVAEFEALLKVVMEHKWKIYQRWPAYGLPAEVAQAILFLLSDAASFITGTSLAVDGGAASIGPHREYIDGLEVKSTYAALRKLAERYPTLRPRRKAPPTQR